MRNPPMTAVGTNSAQRQADVFSTRGHDRVRCTPGATALISASDSSDYVERHGHEMSRPGTPSAPNLTWARNSHRPTDQRPHVASLLGAAWEE